MQGPHKFISIKEVGKQPMAMLPHLEVSIYELTYACLNNPSIKITITTTAESFFAQGLIDKAIKRPNETLFFDFEAKPL